MFMTLTIEPGATEAGTLYLKELMWIMAAGWATTEDEPVGATLELIAELMVELIAELIDDPAAGVVEAVECVDELQALSNPSARTAAEPASATRVLPVLALLPVLGCRRCGVSELVGSVLTVMR
ncbi:hypothetical protein M6D93_11530 [Jatrophihabitans telluris]|uniref:Uncharacterized protein n=1 Tax=Jatrophihabitans telluris TaxID=2038343 RepID=A0ABY4QT64_9ACTN|nr:hypothetical protein [Jatrophihabitans telluris]UQX86936.1 hypothetical protein M6D93_11530 [Jatrophihabitans telluris]